MVVAGGLEEAADEGSISVGLLGLPREHGDFPSVVIADDDHDGLVGDGGGGPRLDDGVEGGGRGRGGGDDRGAACEADVPQKCAPVEVCHVEPPLMM